MRGRHLLALAGDIDRMAVVRVERQVDVILAVLSQAITAAKTILGDSA